MDLANLSLPPELEAFVVSKVSSGEYPSQSAVLRDALALLQRRDQARADRLEELRTMVQQGVEQLECGKSAPWDLEEAKQELRKSFDMDSKYV